MEALNSYNWVPNNETNAWIGGYDSQMKCPSFLMLFFSWINRTKKNCYQRWVVLLELHWDITLVLLHSRELMGSQFILSNWSGASLLKQNSHHRVQQFLLLHSSKLTLQVHHFIHFYSAQFGLQDWLSFYENNNYEGTGTLLLLGFAIRFIVNHHFGPWHCKARRKQIGFSH